jgi:hypothetical protein
MAAAPLTADSVARRLAEPAALVATLEALEAHEGAHEGAVAVAAAAALTEVVLDVPAEHPPAVLQRVGLLRARLLTEADDTDMTAVVTAVLGGGRMFAEYDVTDRMLAKPAEDITREDVYTYGCLLSHFAAAESPGFDAGAEVAESEVMQYVLAQGRAESEPVRLRLCEMAVELLREPGLPQLAICGLVWIPYARTNGRQIGDTSRLVQDRGLVELAVMHLRALGPAQDWLVRGLLHIDMPSAPSVRDLVAAAGCCWVLLGAGCWVLGAACCLPGASAYCCSTCCCAVNAAELCRAGRCVQPHHVHGLHEQGLRRQDGAA